MKRKKKKRDPTKNKKPTAGDRILEALRDLGDLDAFAEIVITADAVVKKLPADGQLHRIPVTSRDGKTFQVTVVRPTARPE